MFLARPRLIDIREWRGQPRRIKTPIFRRARGVKHASVAARHAHVPAVDLRSIVLTYLVDDITLAAHPDVREVRFPDLPRLLGEGLPERPLQVTAESEIDGRAEERQQRREQPRVPDGQPEAKRARVHPSPSSLTE